MHSLRTLPRHGQWHTQNKIKKKIKRSVRGGYYTAPSYDVIPDLLTRDVLG